MPSAMNDPDDVIITGLGAKGDGVGVDGRGQTRFVKFALPGESWRVDDDGERAVSAPSEQRVAPVCRHFGTCGGCTAQHMRDDLYTSWKLGIVRQEFERRNIDPGPLELVEVPLHSRRRAVLSAVREGDHIRLGYHAARSHDIIDLTECPVLAPGIVASFDILRAMAERALGGRGSVRFTVLACQEGLDIDIGGEHQPVGEDARRALAELVREHGIARMTIDGDVVAQFAVPTLQVGGVDVPVPSGTFVQAVDHAETVMATEVASAASGAKTVADLFCGIGTFALVLARKARVLAIDSNGPAVTALDTARRNTQGLKPIETRKRDLFREPLSRKELDDFACVVFDPPRAGAEAQAQALAKSKVPVVVAVSCNPATLARDCGILLDGGYQIDRLRVIDQFRFSAQVECVAVIRRPIKGRPKPGRPRD